MQPRIIIPPTHADHRTADFLAELVKANPHLKVVPFTTVPCRSFHPDMTGALSILGNQGYGMVLTTQTGQVFSSTYQIYWFSRPAP